MFDFETLSMEKVLRKVLMKKYTENVTQKLLPGFDLILVNSSKKSQCIQESLL